VPRLKEVINDHSIDLFGEDLSADTTPATGSETEDEASPGRWDLIEECRLDPARPPARGYTRLSDERISRTDPDATLMRARIDHPRQLGYHTHYAVDDGRKRIILHVLVTPADVMENVPMLDQLRRLRFRWHLHFKRAIADTTYGTTENIVGLEDMGIQAYVLLPADLPQRTTHPFLLPGRL
jgi:hypothetical protein